jgi:hypothetical protein
MEYFNVGDSVRWKQRGIEVMRNLLAFGSFWSALYRGWFIFVFGLFSLSILFYLLSKCKTHPMRRSQKCDFFCPFFETNLA